MYHWEKCQRKGEEIGGMDLEFEISNDELNIALHLSDQIAESLSGFISYLKNLT